MHVYVAASGTIDADGDTWEPGQMPGAGGILGIRRKKADAVKLVTDTWAELTVVDPDVRWWTYVPHEGYVWITILKMSVL